MKYFILGSKGMLGSEFCQHIPDAIKICKPKIDLTKQNDLEKLFKYVKKDDIIINCAAYTNVDQAEYEIDEAFKINAELVKFLIEHCERAQAKLIHFSTDYVFNGKKENPYTENDITGPLNIYGKSKVKGEKYLLDSEYKNYIIARISWLYGKGGKNFIQTIINLSKIKSVLPIVNDQKGSPTYTEDVVNIIQKLIKEEYTGLIHASNDEFTTWFDLSNVIKENLKLEIEIQPCSSEDFKRPAVRPKNSCLDTNKLKALGIKNRNWKEALTSYLKEL